MTRLLSVLSLTGLMLGSVGLVRGDQITSKWEAPREVRAGDRLVDEVAQQLAKSALAAAAPAGESLVSMDLSIAPEGRTILDSSAMALPLESLTGHSTESGDHVVTVEGEPSGLPVMVSADRGLQQPRNQPNELASPFSSVHVRHLLARLDQAKSPIFALFGTAFVGLFFRTRILRERRATLAIPQ